MSQSTHCATLANICVCVHHDESNIFISTSSWKCLLSFCDRVDFLYKRCSTLTRCEEIHPSEHQKCRHTDLHLLNPNPFHHHPSLVLYHRHNNAFRPFISCSLPRRTVSAAACSRAEQSCSHTSGAEGACRSSRRRPCDSAGYSAEYTFILFRIFNLVYLFTFPPLSH